MTSYGYGRGVACAALLTGVFLAGTISAQAQRARTPKPPAAVQVTNARGVILTGLVVRGADGAVVGSLSQPLSGTKTVRLALKQPKGCLYSVEAAFEDESEASSEGVDLCQDPKIRLVE